MESLSNMPTAADYAWAEASKARSAQASNEATIADLTKRVEQLEQQVLALGLRFAGHSADPA